VLLEPMQMGPKKKKKITERLIIINGLFLIDFKWNVLGPLILITIAD
jgi:hypothetical protein